MEYRLDDCLIMNTRKAARALTRRADRQLRGVGITAIRDSYEKKLAQAPQEEKTRIVNEADTAMQKAVTDQGLSVTEYSTILQVAQNDPAVREKLISRLK